MSNSLIASILCIAAAAPAIGGPVPNPNVSGPIPAYRPSASDTLRSVLS